ncbi:hypothetical protein GLYMA_13G297150v4 [Glycine max]|nr:hypothetical protein GLYMA_13G297150v4 [Glycine max]KAH1104035.1 hypothetical protein GYH30_037786 [Glycine max]
MEDVSDAFGEEAKVGGLAPNEEVEGDVEKFAAAVVIGGVGFVIGEPDRGFGGEVVAPGGVVAEEFCAEGAEDGGVEGFGGRGEAHLGVGEVEDEVLALVANVVGLEPEEEGKPVQEVHTWLPFRGAEEVPDGVEGGGGGADLREAEGWMVGERGVEGDDVVGLNVVVVAISDRHVMGNVDPEEQGTLRWFREVFVYYYKVCLCLERKKGGLVS